MAANHYSFNSKLFLIRIANATRGKDIIANSKSRIQQNKTFMGLNKQIREAISSGDVGALITAQRHSLQFTSEEYGRKGDLQSLSLLRNVEDQFKLVQDPDEYKRNC